MRKIGRDSSYLISLLASLTQLETPQKKKERMKISISFFTLFKSAAVIIYNEIKS
jgi:uncharacterized protein with PQ loop repeat